MRVKNKELRARRHRKEQKIKEAKRQLLADLQNRAATPAAPKPAKAPAAPKKPAAEGAEKKAPAAKKAPAKGPQAAVGEELSTSNNAEEATTKPAKKASAKKTEEPAAE